MEVNEVRHILTYDCILKCKHCYLSAGEHPNIVTKKFTQQQADKFYSYFKPEVVSATGGEPLLYPELVRILAKSTAKYGGALELVTNGILLNEKMVKELNLLNKDLHYQISLDGLAKSHDKMRGKKGAFNQAIRAIKIASSSGRLVKARMTVTPENFAEIPELIGYLDSLENCNKIKLVMRSVLTTGRARRNEIAFSHNFPKELPKYQKMVRRIEVSITDRCGYCLDSLSIDPMGDIFPCCYFVFNREYLMGNWLNDPKILQAQPDFASFTGKCLAVTKLSRLESPGERCEVCIENDLVKSK